VKNKKLLLLLIILFPSAFWLILETSTINTRKLPHHGPKTWVGKDTVFYSVVKVQFPTVSGAGIQNELFDTIRYPLLALTFIKPGYAKENFRLDGVMDYTQYKQSEIEHLPLLLVYPNDERSFVKHNLRDSLKIASKNIHQCFWKEASFDSLNITYFLKKPSHVDYSFIVLLDKKRHIRGYYDGRYSAEVKRLLGEYQHLRIREEKNTMLRENEIKDEKNK
jgi:hypothetical protein